MCLKAPHGTTNPLLLCFLVKVVVKTKTEYEPDRKKSKARPPQIAEFTVSVTEGVTGRFKVSGPGGGLLLCPQEVSAQLACGVMGTGDTTYAGRPQPCKANLWFLKFLLFSSSKMIVHFLVLIMGKTHS